MEFPNYTKYLIEPVSDEWEEIIIAELEELPFESFVNEDEKIAAYIPTKSDDDDITNAVQNIRSIKSFTKEIIQGQNWNATWEAQFEPIEIERECRVRAVFHEPSPNFKYEIVIQPQMSFGTGHHTTTYLMMKGMLKVDFIGKKVLDMGCGTGILGILACKMGSVHVVGVDNDPICVENTKENLSLNNVKNFEALLLSDFTVEKEYEVILANIQRNVIIEQLPMYKHVLKGNGTLFVSGIYVDMIDEIKTKAESEGFIFEKKEVKDEWAMIKFRN